MTMARMQDMGRIMLLACMVLALSACGSRKALKARPGMDPAPVAYGADRAATPAEMVQPDRQARPDRSAEPLLRSQERPDDPFDLPPS